MERFTKRIDQYVYYAKGRYTDTIPDEMNTEDTRNVLKRLAAYEDTGLEPDEVITGKELAEIACAMLELKQYKDAEKEGRCVFLPAKVGDTIYQIRGKNHALGRGISPRKVRMIGVWSDGDYVLLHQGATDCKRRDYRRTWFLTKEEAEAALEKEANT